MPSPYHREFNNTEEYESDTMRAIKAEMAKDPEKYGVDSSGNDLPKKEPEVEPQKKPGFFETLKASGRAAGSGLRRSKELIAAYNRAGGTITYEEAGRILGQKGMGKLAQTHAQFRQKTKRNK